MNVVWRCAVCHRKKELNGKHLENKTQVRSDCWPCGKKRTFLRESDKDIVTCENESAILDTSKSFANDAVAAAATATTTLTCHSISTAKSTLHVSPNLNTCTIPTLTDENINESACRSDSRNKNGEYVKCSGDINNSNNKNNRSNNSSSSSYSTSFTNSAKMSEEEKSAQIAAKTKNEITGAFRNSFIIQNIRPQSALETKCKSPFIVQTTTGTSPPFTFKAAPMFPCTMPSEQNDTNMLDNKISVNRNQEQLRSSLESSSSPQPDAEVSTETATSTAALSKPTALWKPNQYSNTFERKTALLNYSSSHNTLAVKEVWKCAVCGKVKDLHGEHLRNKTSVRSDCWPCGKKQTFVLSAARASSLVKEDNYAAGQHSTSLTINLANTSSSAKNDAYLRHSPESSDKVQELCHEEDKRKEKHQEEECKENVSEKNVKCHASTTYLPNAEKSLVARVFVQPIIPPSANVEDYFMQPICASSSSSSSEQVLCALTNLTLPHSTSAHTENNNSDTTKDNTVCVTSQIVYHLFTRSLFIHLRTLSSRWPPRRCVWHETSNTLYVLLTEKELESPLYDNNNYDNNNNNNNNENEHDDEDSKFCCSAAKLRSQRRVKKEGSVEMSQVSTKNDCGVFTNAAHIRRNINDAEILGKYAAHLFAIEQMIVQSSPFKRVTHWFCDSELSFAACCCYASQTCPDMHLHCGCNNTSSCKSHGNNLHKNKLDSNGLCNDADANIDNDSNENDGNECDNCYCQTYCSIYGPVPDPTRARTTFGNIIVNAESSHFPCSMLSSSPPHDEPSIRVFPTIVSEEQRIAAAQEFYRRTSWLTLPMYMNGMAIHLKESLVSNNCKNNKTNNDYKNESNSNIINNDICCEENVSVVLVAATMKLEELTQAATWTLPPTP